MVVEDGRVRKNDLTGINCVATKGSKVHFEQAATPSMPQTVVKPKIFSEWEEI